MDIIKIIVVVAVLGLIGWMGYDWYLGSNPVEEAPVQEDLSQIYKWKDRKGVLHYTNDPGTIPENARSLAKNVELPNLNEFDEESAKNFMKTGIGADLPTITKTSTIDKRNRVSFYFVSWCPNCKKVRELLDKYGVVYADYNVEKQITSTQMLSELTGGNNVVPVLDIAGVVIVGYQPERIYNILKDQKRIRHQEEY